MKNWTIVLYSIIATWIVSKFAQVDGWAVSGYKKWFVCIILASCLTIILYEIERIAREVFRK